MKKFIIIGYKYKEGSQKPVIKGNPIIRDGTIIYNDVNIEEQFVSGHNVLIREKTSIGKNVLVGTNTVIEGNVKIGNNVRIQSNCYICTNVVIGNNVFIGPNVTFTNDKYPLRNRQNYRPVGAFIDNNVTIGAGSVIGVGIKIRKDSFIGSCSNVLSNVNSGKLVYGNPAKEYSLPKNLNSLNKIK